MIPATSSRSSGSGRRSHYPGRHEERTGLSRIEEEHAGEGIDAALRAERLAERWVLCAFLCFALNELK